MLEGGVGGSPDQAGGVPRWPCCVPSSPRTASPMRALHGAKGSSRTAPMNSSDQGDAGDWRRHGCRPMSGRGRGSAVEGTGASMSDGRQPLEGGSRRGRRRGFSCSAARKPPAKAHISRAADRSIHTACAGGRLCYRYPPITRSVPFPRAPPARDATQALAVRIPLRPARRPSRRSLVAVPIPLRRRHDRD